MRTEPQVHAYPRSRRPQATTTLPPRGYISGVPNLDPIYYQNPEWRHSKGTSNNSNIWNSLSPAVETGDESKFGEVDFLHTAGAFYEKLLSIHYWIAKICSIAQPQSHAK